MAVQPAELHRPEAADGSEPFVPAGAFGVYAEEFDYVEEEWFASGVVDGHFPDDADEMRNEAEKATVP